MSKSKKIGEGSFGCVFKPSIKCKNHEIEYDINNISKLMIDNEVDDEMLKYKEIQKIDKEQKFHLSPDTCIPDDSWETKQAVLECTDSNKILGDYDNYKLFVMKYGGPSLTQYFRIPMENTFENRERINNFWINSIELFNGLILFLENGIVHHDLKPDNIVYDESINSVKIIDYGLMQYKDKMIRKSEESRYNNSKFHFNYPLETALYNKNTFLTIKKTGDISSERVQHYFRDEIKDSYHYALSGLMTYIKNEDLHPQIEYSIENGFYDFLDNAKYDDSTYTLMLNKSINTFDMYGLGMSLFYVLNKVYKLMEPDIVKKLDTLFTKMIHPDVQERIELKNALFLYKNIIQNMPLPKKTDPIIQQIPIKPKPETTYDFTSSELRMSSDSQNSNKGGKSRTRRRKKSVKYVNRRSKCSRRIKKKRSMRSR